MASVNALTFKGVIGDFRLSQRQQANEGFAAHFRPIVMKRCGCANRDATTISMAP